MKFFRSTEREIAVIGPLERSHDTRVACCCQCTLGQSHFLFSELTTQLSVERTEQRRQQFQNWEQVPVPLSQEHLHQLIFPLVGKSFAVFAESGLCHPVNVMANLVIQDAAYQDRPARRNDHEEINITDLIHD